MDLQKYFNHAYILTMSSRPDRLNAMMQQFDQIGIDKDFIDAHYATPFPHNDIIANAFNLNKRGNFTKANEYDCARNHYSIVREAYDRGFNHIIIFEDDLQFLNNIDLWDIALSNMPQDYDILQFGGFTADPNIKKYLTTEKDFKWTKHKDIGLWNCSMYALSRKGMQFYLAFMDKFFWVADGPLYKAPINDKIVNAYMASVPLVIQADKKIVSSDIRDESNDNIDYMHQNLYESLINKEKYFAY